MATTEKNYNPDRLGECLWFYCVQSAAPKSLRPIEPVNIDLHKDIKVDIKVSENWIEITITLTRDSLNSYARGVITIRKEPSAIYPVTYYVSTSDADSAFKVLEKMLHVQREIYFKVDEYRDKNFPSAGAGEDK